MRAGTCHLFSCPASFSLQELPWGLLRWLCVGCDPGAAPPPLLPSSHHHGPEQFPASATPVCLRHNKDHVFLRSMKNGVARGVLGHHEAEPGRSWGRRAGRGRGEGLAPGTGVRCRRHSSCPAGQVAPRWPPVPCAYHGHAASGSGHPPTWTPAPARTLLLPRCRCVSGVVPAHSVSQQNSHRASLCPRLKDNLLGHSECSKSLLVRPGWPRWDPRHSLSGPLCGRGRALPAIPRLGKVTTRPDSSPRAGRHCCLLVPRSHPPTRPLPPWRPLPSRLPVCADLSHLCEVLQVTTGRACVCGGGQSHSPGHTGKLEMPRGQRSEGPSWGPRVPSLGRRARGPRASSCAGSLLATDLELLSPPVKRVGDLGGWRGRAEAALLVEAALQVVARTPLPLTASRRTWAEPRTRGPLPCHLPTAWPPGGCVGGWGNLPRRGQRPAQQTKPLVRACPLLPGSWPRSHPLLTWSSTEATGQWAVQEPCPRTRAPAHRPPACVDQHVRRPLVTTAKWPQRWPTTEEQKEDAPQGKRCHEEAWKAPQSSGRGR